MKAVKLFVWDFHGVLERGNDQAIMEVSNMALASHRFSQRFSLEQCEQCAGLKWVEYFARLLPDSPHQVHVDLHATCLEITKNHPELISKHIDPNEHATYVLEQIDASPYTQILISNTQSQVLDWFVSHLSMERFFPASHRFGVDSHYLHASKQECLKAFLKERTFPEGVVAIGDSPSDMQLTTLHPKSVGYMYTYPGRNHRPADCHYKIHDLRHVLKEVRANVPSEANMLHILMPFFLASADLFGVDFILILYAILSFVAIGAGLTLLILLTKAKFVKQQACTIKINEDARLTKTVLGGGTLLSVLTSNEIPIPCPCGGKATCKQCRVQILKGVGEALETDKATFTKKQLKEGWRLSCQAKVKGHLHLHIDPHALSVKEWHGTVISNENVATFIKELIVEIPAGEQIPYRSGGYLQFHVPPFKTNSEEWKHTMDASYFPDWEKFNLFGRKLDFSGLPTGNDEVIRAYSLASYPAEGCTLKFNIRIATPPFFSGKISEEIPWGICSSYTFSLKPGDKVRLSGPYGESFMIDDGRELVFLIGGAGSSFGRSHILHLFYTEKTKRKVSLWYGARSVKENIYQQEYEKLAAEFENFTYHLVLSEPLPEDIAAGWPQKDPIKTNYLFRAFETGQLKQMDSPEECLFYVCGPPMHNKSVLKLLDDYGVPRENIVLDDFGN